jgi:hypothetical protein
MEQQQRNDDQLQDSIRLEVNRFIFQNGFAPTAEQLAEVLTLPAKEVERGLQLLAENHAIVLHPNSSEIWVAHPFALFPTLFWVKSHNKKFWSNCIWCSLGLASLINEDVDIFTKLNGEEDSIIIQIRDGKIVQNNYLAHFPIPAKHLWDNVIYSCAMMLVFSDEEEVDEWCRRHNKKKGDVVPLDTVWTLAKIWYGNYLSDNFKRKTKEIAEEMFVSVGLTSPFWKF